MLLQLVQAQQSMIERMKGSQSAPVNLQPPTEVTKPPEAERLAPTEAPKPAAVQQDPGDSLADHASAIILLYSCKYRICFARTTA